MQRNNIALVDLGQRDHELAVPRDLAHELIVQALRRNLAPFDVLHRFSPRLLRSRKRNMLPFAPHITCPGRTRRCRGCHPVAASEARDIPPSGTTDAPARGWEIR